VFALTAEKVVGLSVADDATLCVGAGGERINVGWENEAQGVSRPTGLVEAGQERVRDTGSTAWVSRAYGGRKDISRGIRGMVGIGVVLEDYL